MKSFALSICTLALLAATVPAQAQENGPRYYAGDFSCRDSSYATDWVISPNDSTVNVRVYYQQVGSTRINWLDLIEHRSGTSTGLYDAKGNGHLEILGDSQRMQAAWANRAGPGTDCAPFVVQRSEAPKQRFDSIFALMETPDPDEATAVSVGDLTRFPPIIFALPELDQQTYSRRYQELERQFWTNYRTKLSTDLATMKLATPEDIVAFSTRLTTALEGGLTFEPSREAHSSIYGLMQQAADRLAANGGSVPAAFYSGAQDTCARFQGILARGDWYDFTKLELATRVPVEYWSREVADEVITGIRSCAGVHQNYAQELTNKWPEFQQRQQVVAQAVAEQARLLALPVTMTTLVDTNNLQPSEAVTAQLRNRSDYNKRFFEAPLTPRRQELLEASLAFITEQSAQYSGTDPSEVPAVIALCDKAKGVSNMLREDRTRLGQLCETATTAVAEKQAGAAIAQVELAFAGAAPESEQATQARELCGTLRSELPYEVANKVETVCRDADSKLLAAETSLRCERAVQASGASSDLLDSRIALNTGDGTSLRHLVCRASEQKTQISFASSGFMMWERQTLQMTMNEQTLSFVLNPAEGQQADWLLGVEDEWTASTLADMGVKVEAITACVLGLNSCRS